MSRVGQYDHLPSITMDLNLDEFAAKLITSNYGVHRMLSALVRANKETDFSKSQSNILVDIEKLLDQGKF